MKISFWLIPSKEDKAFFQEIINRLAREYNAPTFTPHVTIYSGEYTSNDFSTELIEQATQGIQSFSLKVDRILYTEQFTKSLFVQFQPNQILSNISESLRYGSKKQSNFELNPHLSLIYKNLSQEIKQDLTKSIILPTEVSFNEVSAIATLEKVQNREDVESWKVIYTKNFN